MINAFTEILRSWQTFYFTIGGAAAALLGLMFVAVSLALPVITTGISADMKAFVNPSVYYFVSELVLVFVMLVPSYDPVVLGGLLVLGGLPGLVVTLRHARQLVTVALKNQDFVLGDWLAQIILPVVAYLLIGVGGISFVGIQWSLGFAVLWIASVLLLLCAIANTWSLVLWIVEQKFGKG